LAVKVLVTELLPIAALFEKSGTCIEDSLVVKGRRFRRRSENIKHFVVKASSGVKSLSGACIVADTEW
jgi:hypothetical protein